MKSIILASMMTAIPTSSMETHLLGNLGRAAMPVAEDAVVADPVEETKVVASCSDCATGPVRAVLRTQPIRSCVSRQPVRSCARRAVSVRPLQRLFGGFRRCR
jgi:hypothetical protein